jgi:hypothetical protein
MANHKYTFKLRRIIIVIILVYPINKNNFDISELIRNIEKFIG